MSSSDRNWESRQYKAWRLSVKKRDGFKCRQCGSRKRLQVHHIKRWTDHPEIRFAATNGITLCRSCHGQIWDKEGDFEELFRKMVNPDSLIQIQRLLYEARQREEPES